MDRKEFALFAMALKTYFPRESLLPTQEAMELWYRSLADIPYRLAETFLQKWVSTEKWSPTVADIRRECADIVEGDKTDWAEGWKEVKKAIGRYGYIREEEALNSMSGITRETVERLGWRNICLSENEISERANFRAVYELLEKRESEERQLPASLKKLIADGAKNRSIYLAEQKE